MAKPTGLLSERESRQRLLKKAGEGGLAATISRARVLVIGFVLLGLTCWATLFLVSISALPAPNFVAPLLTATAFPLFAVLGLTLWHGGKRSSVALAYRDDLTDLGNRRAFRALTSERLRGARAGSLALILVDVDELKRVNDECGHQAGDELLILLARRLQKVAPERYLVFRFGGDEFALLVDRSTGEAAAEVIARLEPFESEFAACGHEHTVHISYGFVSNSLGESFDSLFSRADQRLRDFKRRPSHSERAAGGRSTRQTELQAGPLTGKITSLEERRYLHRRRVRP
jgi:diguanylate cyclase (GGDEF)-like protein